MLIFFYQIIRQIVYVNICIQQRFTLKSLSLPVYLSVFADHAQIYKENIRMSIKYARENNVRCLDDYKPKIKSEDKEKMKQRKCFYILAWNVDGNIFLLQHS